MELYNLIIYKIIVFYIPQKNRTIKKTYYKKIGIITDVPKTDVSKKMIELYNALDTCYIVIDIKQNGARDTEYDYYSKLNNKSVKMYLELKNNKDLIQFNSEYKKQHFTLKYDINKYDLDIIKRLLKDIDWKD